MSEDKKKVVESSSTEKLEVKKKCLENLFIILNYFTRVLDYDELDINRFLNTRKRKKYYRLLSIKIVFFFLFYFTIISSSFFIPKIPDNCQFFLGFLLGSIVYSFIFIWNYLDNLSFKKFGFTHSYYHKEKNEIKNFQDQIKLLFKNKFLLDLY